MSNFKEDWYVIEGRTFSIHGAIPIWKAIYKDFIQFKRDRSGEFSIHKYAHDPEFYKYVEERWNSSTTMTELFNDSYFRVYTNNSGEVFVTDLVHKGNVTLRIGIDIFAEGVRVTSDLNNFVPTSHNGLPGFIIKKA